MAATQSAVNPLTEVSFLMRDYATRFGSRLFSICALLHAAVGIFHLVNISAFGLPWKIQQLLHANTHTDSKQKKTLSCGCELKVAQEPWKQLCRSQSSLSHKHRWQAPPCIKSTDCSAWHVIKQNNRVVFRSDPEQRGVWQGFQNTMGRACEPASTSASFHLETMFG